MYIYIFTTNRTLVEGWAYKNMKHPSPKIPSTTPAQSGTDDNDNIGVKTKIIIVTIIQLIFFAVLILSWLGISIYGMQFSVDPSVQIALVSIVGLPIVYFWKRIFGM